MQNYKIMLVSGADTSMTAEEFVDVFEVCSGARPLFRVTLNHGSDTDDASATVKNLTDVEAVMLPYIGSNFELATLVHDRLMMLLDEINGEFFADVFAETESVDLYEPMTVKRIVNKTTLAVSYNVEIDGIIAMSAELKDDDILLSVDPKFSTPFLVKLMFQAVQREA